MSKKKNTLKDLDEFLKQQAATLVTPPRLNEIPEAPDAEQTPEKPAVRNTDSSTSISKASIINNLQQLSKVKGDNFKSEFHDIILKVLEDQDEYSPEDKMLVNTILYLKHGSDWKDEIRKFWSARKA